ncbi:RNase J family beta-CASP ribonuclease [Alkalibaculum sp. M08DMB]|uniref:Ribonuclease J n=1 Tax=Alkalibaculum sporogenes TaxID=2655001 RepID=A0A6A7K9Y8_9FIRM|nr:ribonuclease J [Alkalibaculum sporogenes]MPW26308.1 RNase J family beta-CASP ribonuclease [Alkalibaculum sporogenes]
MTTKKSKLKVIPLGGLGEVGKNITLFEYKKDIVIVDCGIAFPDESMFGIDIVLPDYTYLVNNKDRVKAIVLTHGHEDHIGGIPYLLKELNVPIYGTKLTIGLVENKLNEHKLLDTTERIVVKPKDVVKIGGFEIEFIRTNHSIADSVALFIKCEAAKVLHTGDFKIDYNPIDDEVIDLKRFAELGTEGVDLLMADSTNVELPGYTLSESSVGKTFMELFNGVKSRILVASFASSVHRVQQIADAAIAHNRKIALSGRSMINVSNTALELGYLHIPQDALVDIRDINKYDPSEIVVISTGSQGEPLAALSRMAAGEYRQLSINAGDLVIISASPIPGNEKMINRVINNLYKLGANVIYEKLADIHVSGHAKQEELKLVHTLVKPKNFVPVHGEYRMLMHHAKLAQELGMCEENTIVAENGGVIEVDETGCKVIGKVPSGITLVDGLGIGDVGNIVLRDRKHLSEDGLFIVVVTLSKGKTVAGPDVISRGFVYVRESEELINNARRVVKEALSRCEEKNIYEWNKIKGEIKESLDQFLFEKTKRKPMILPILMEV